MNKEFVQTIFARRSIRKYTAEPVDEGIVKTLLQAAMAAPSSANRKPWHFVVTADRKTLDSLAESHPYGKMLFEAPLCISVCGDPAISEGAWVQDCSAATENLLLAVATLGLGAVWLGVHPKEERLAFTRRILGIPETIVPLNLISIGHQAEEKAPRTQYDEARVHRGKW